MRAALVAFALCAVAVSSPAGESTAVGETGERGTSPAAGASAGDGNRGVGRGEGGKVIRLSLRGAVSRALETAERIKEARAGLAGAAAAVGQARAAGLPQLSADASFTRNKRELTESDRAISELATFFAGGFGVDPGAVGGDELLPERYSKLYTAGLSARQTIFAGGSILNSVRAARAARDAASAGVRSARELVIAGVVRDYYVVLLAGAVHKVRSSSHRLAQEHYEDMVARRKARAASRFEVLRAKVAMQNQEAQMINSELLARRARLGLLRRIGAPQDSRLDLVSSFGSPAALPGLREGLGLAAANRSDLVARSHDLRAREHDVRAARGGYYPTLAAVARWGGQSDDDPFEGDEFDESGYLGLELHWNFFDGLMTRSRVAAARAELDRVRWQRRGLRRDVELQVRRSLLSLRSAVRFIGAQGANVAEAREALRLAGVRQKAGAGTELEVQDARNQLERAELNYVRSLYDYCMAKLEYYAATGTLEKVEWPGRKPAKAPGGEPSSRPLKSGLREQERGEQ